MLGEDGIYVCFAYSKLRMVPGQGKPLRRFPPAAFAKLTIVHVRMPPPDVHTLQPGKHILSELMSPGHSGMVS